MNKNTIEVLVDKLFNKCCQDIEESLKEAFLQGKNITRVHISESGLNCNNKFVFKYHLYE
jgi:hypothetical protein